MQLAFYLCLRGTLMFSTLRTKLLIGLTPLLALMVGLGLWAIVMFSDLGNKIDVILRENYRSVLAAQNMKEALERMDSAALFAIGGRDDLARQQFAEFAPVFEKNLKIEQNNVTLPGEQEMADNLTEFYDTTSNSATASMRFPRSRASGPSSTSPSSCRRSRRSSGKPTRCSTSTSGTWRPRTTGPSRPRPGRSG